MTLCYMVHFAFKSYSNNNNKRSGNRDNFNCSNNNNIILNIFYLQVYYEFFTSWPWQCSLTWCAHLFSTFVCFKDVFSFLIVDIELLLLMMPDIYIIHSYMVEIRWLLLVYSSQTSSSNSSRWSSLVYSSLQTPDWVENHQAGKISAKN